MFAIVIGLLVLAVLDRCAVIEPVDEHPCRKVAAETNVHVNLTGQYAGTREDLAKNVTTAIRDAVRRGQLPKNTLTGL